MAAESAELRKYLEENAPRGSATPCAHYDPDSDAMTFFFSNEPEYRKRLNSRVTVYFSDDRDELVGCRIKNVRRVLEDIGWFPVIINHGKVRLNMLFLAMRAEFGEEPDGRQIYRQIGEQISRSDLEVAVPALP